ncbi:MAG: lysylphosphatidylglycerol synthase transmembrane domain-containing protein [Pseudolabrys sp.]
MRKAISLLLKAAVSGLLLYLALRLVNLDTVAQRLRDVRIGWLALSVVILVGQTALLALRWQQIVRQCGASMPFTRLFRFTMVGTFFNQTLPSSVGGDAMRIWLLGRQQDWRVASYSVLLDRLIGLVMLACVVVVCLPWTFALVQDPVGRIALLAIGLGSLGGWVVFLVLGWERWRFLQRWSLTRHVAATATVAIGILRAPRTLGTVTLISVMSHMLTALCAWCVAHAVSADLSFPNAIFVVLPVALIAVVPISIAGWGVREGAMIAAFAYAGLPQSDGLLVSILFGVSYLVLGVLGGLVWVLGPQPAKAGEDREIVADGRVNPS